MVFPPIQHVGRAMFSPWVLMGGRSASGSTQNSSASTLAPYLVSLSEYRSESITPILYDTIGQDVMWDLTHGSGRAAVTGFGTLTCDRMGGLTSG